jgi:hypothetical protein
MPVFSKETLAKGGWGPISEWHIQISINDSAKCPGCDKSCPAGTEVMQRVRDTKPDDWAFPEDFDHWFCKDCYRKYVGNTPKEGRNRMKIKYRLEKWEKAIVFQILEMDERFRTTEDGPGDGIKYVCKTNDMLVRSSSYPRLEADIIWLRGEDKEDDLDIICRLFDTNKERDIYYSKVQAALNDWANNWEGWSKEEPEAPPHEPNIFVL